MDQQQTKNPGAYQQPQAAPSSHEQPPAPPSSHSTFQWILLLQPLICLEWSSPVASLVGQSPLLCALSSCELLSGMPNLQVARRICVNDIAVPVKEVTLAWIDPFNVDPPDRPDPDDKLSVSLVALKVTVYNQWLVKALELPNDGWRRYATKVGLLKEIQQKIRVKKVLPGRANRLPKNSKYLLPLEVRGKVLWFQNTSMCVVLAVRDEALGDLQWFLEELHKELQTKISGEADAGPDDPQPTADDLQVPVSECLKTIKEHAGCYSATWLPSKLSFRVKRKGDNAMKDFRIQRLKKKKVEAEKRDCKQVLDNQFHDAIPLIQDLLSALPGAAASPNSSAPLEDMSQESGLEVMADSDAGNNGDTANATAPAPAEDLVSDAPAAAPAPPAPRPRRKIMRGKQGAS